MIDLSRYRYHSLYDSFEHAHNNITRLYFNYYRYVDYLIVTQNSHAEIWIADKKNIK